MDFLNKSHYIRTMECYVTVKRNKAAQYVPILKGLHDTLSVESKEKKTIVHRILCFT